MVEIETKEHLDIELSKHTNMVCLLFTTKGHQQGKVLSKVLTNECNKKDIGVLNISINNKNLFYLINSYGTGLLPKYIFIRKGSIIHTAYGMTSKKNIIQEIKKAKDNI